MGSLVRYVHLFQVEYDLLCTRHFYGRRNEVTKTSEGRVLLLCRHKMGLQRTATVL